MLDLRYQFPPQLAPGLELWRSLQALHEQPRNKQKRERSKSGLDLALKRRRIPLCPLLEQLPDNFTAGQLGHLVNELDAAHKSLVLCDLIVHPLVNVIFCHFALVFILECDIASRPLLVVPTIQVNKGF